MDKPRKRHVRVSILRIRYEIIKKQSNPYGDIKQGNVTIGGKTYYYKSSWESDIAAYLEFLKNKKEISDWEYEPHTFWFERIKRGVRSYKPDFRVTNTDGSQYYIEVKGWMDSRSATKLKRMRIYYPEVRVDVIDRSRYIAIAKWASVIPHWGELKAKHDEPAALCSVKGCKAVAYKKGMCDKHYYLTLIQSKHEKKG